MEVQAFDRESGGCYSCEKLCVKGVHVHKGIGHCHHNDDYTDTYRLIGKCDGTCQEADTRVVDPDDDFTDMFPSPPRMVEVSDYIVVQITTAFEQGQGDFRLEIDRHNQE